MIVAVLLKVPTQSILRLYLMIYQIRIENKVIKSYTSYTPDVY